MTDGSDTGNEKLVEGTLLSHLVELRNRLMHSLIAVGILAVPCLYFANDLFGWITEPLRAQLPAGTSMIATSVVAPFMTPFKLGLLAAVFLAMPYLLYQLWAFVAPGLYRHERRFALPLLLSSILLFYVGAAFAYLVVFPVMFQFFVSTTPAGVAMMTDMTQYLDFVVLLFFAFGLAFEIPIATVLLAKTGIVSVDSLGGKRGFVLLGIFIVAAFLTPPDPVSQTMMAVPMYLLYEGGILLARVLVRNAPRPEGEDEESDASSA
jgi:sec-independent protein translocase protein TatC